MTSKNSKPMLPAVPPVDYAGSIADWMTGLIERGLWDGKNPEGFGDVMISQEDYAELLIACEED